MNNKNGDNERYKVYGMRIYYLIIIYKVRETWRGSRMEVRTDRHKKVQCDVCCRCIRSDTLARHMESHKDILSMEDGDIRAELHRRNAVHEHQRVCKKRVMEIAMEEGIPAYNNQVVPVLDMCNLEADLWKDHHVYLNKIELGKRISEILEKGILEDSLTKDRRDALYLYHNQKAKRNTGGVDLRPWQQELMTLITSPSDREVIWVQGMRGNEGKSWFQEYLTSFFGHGRVVQLDLKMKTSNVLHALRKRPLSSVDVFLFNEPRAINYESCNYSILESIKDGIAVSSKYDNDIIHFKTPNTVIVFSNGCPSMKQLSRDRWCVLRITKSGLNNVTDTLWKNRHGAGSSTFTKGGSTYNTPSVEEDGWGYE